MATQFELEIFHKVVQKYFLPQIGASEPNFLSVRFFNIKKLTFLKVNISKTICYFPSQHEHYSVICDDLINKMQIAQKTTIDQTIYIALHKKRAGV